MNGGLMKTMTEKSVKEKGDMQNIKVAQKLTRRIKYVLSDVYNNLVLLDTCMGQKVFRIFKVEFAKRMRVKGTQSVVKKSCNKRFMDIRMQSKEHL